MTKPVHEKVANKYTKWKNYYSYKKVGLYICTTTVWSSKDGMVLHCCESQQLILYCIAIKAKRWDCTTLLWRSMNRIVLHSTLPVTSIPLTVVYQVATIEPSRNSSSNWEVHYINFMPFACLVGAWAFPLTTSTHLTTHIFSVWIIK